MSDESAGRPGQPGKPHRFYFDDLADEDAEPTTPALPAAEPPAPAALPIQSPAFPEALDDDLADTGPIEVIRDPVLGSAAGQQLFFDDLAPMQHASGPISAADPSDDVDSDDIDADRAAVYGAGVYGADVYGAGVESDDEGAERPVRGALALAAARRPRPVGAVLAVLAVLALVGVLAAVGGRGHSGGKARDSAAIGSAAPTGQPSAAGSMQSPSTSATQSGTSTGTSTATSAAPSPSGRHSNIPAKAPAGIELTVLNNTIKSGLAKSAAQEFSTRGWQVGTVGNYTGQLSVTTVYYDVGDATQRKAAQTLAAQFPGVTQVQPRPAGLPGSGLTVVLAPDWHA